MADIATLSIIVLSCRRLQYLSKTLERCRLHFATIETAVRPNWICFDNGSTVEEQQQLRLLGFDTLLLSRENIGIGPAMNRLVACVRSPYFLALQDDWLLENPNAIRFVEESMRILESDPKLAHVKLDACHFLDFNNRTVYAGPYQVEGGGVQFYVQNPQQVWGGFCFPPAITRTSAIHELGPFREDRPFGRGWAESEYCARFARNFCAVKSPQMALFRHIGERSAAGAWGQAPEGARSEPVNQGAPSAGTTGIARVACLLTAFRRPQNLNLQIDAVRAQTVKPSEIAVWQNFHPEHQFEQAALDRVPHVRSTNSNWGVWPRFLFCSEFESEYVCVFDDDAIPGPRWLENCLETIRTHEGLLGTLGVIFVNGTRGQQAKVGWFHPVEHVVEVDIVGHAWFFKRSWLRYFALEPRCGARTAGEDYHFSVALQKHLGLGTFVPPHQPNDKSAWGSTNGELGNDKVALYLQPGEDQNKEDAHNGYLAAGWLPLALRGKLPPIKAAAGNGVTTPAHVSAKSDEVADFKFEQDFVRDLDKLDIRGKPFAFVRLGDGEAAMCAGRPVRTGDGWSYDGTDTRFARKLRDLVQSDMAGLYVGISCRCCDPDGHRWYREHLRAPLWRVTFANLFVNANYSRFKALDWRGTVLVSSQGGNFTVPRNAVNPEFDYSPLLQELFQADRPILVAAGPVGKLIIYDYWRLAPRRQTIIDIGSALDPLIYGRGTRGYHDPSSPTAKKVCIW